MPSIIQQSFPVNLQAMRFFFLYPPDKYKTLYRIHTYIVYFLFVVPIPVLQCLYLVFQEDLHFTQFADSVFLLAEMVCFVLKLYPFLNNGERIKKCIHYFDSAIFEVERNTDQEILQHCINMCRRISMLFLAAVTGAFISWSTRPISWKDHVFPTNVWLPFDVKTAPKSYITYTYLYILIGK